MKRKQNFLTTTYALFFGAMALLLTAGLQSCNTPTEPTFESPFDLQNENFIEAGELETTTVFDTRAFEAKSGGNFISEYGKQVTAKGVCWSTIPEPSLEDTCSNDGSGFGVFDSHITELEIETEYYVRAYAVNEDSTIYGNQRTFTTLNGIPNIRTEDPLQLKAFSAIIGASLRSDGGAEITDWGLCYSNGGDLELGTANCFSAMANNVIADNLENYYNSIKNQSTIKRDYSSTTAASKSDGVSPPALSDITDPYPAFGQRKNMRGQDKTSLLSDHSSVSQIGNSGTPALMKALNMPTTPLISQSLSIPQENTISEDFTIELHDLTPNTVYKFRAYANNVLGSFYGEQKEFITHDLAVVATLPLSNITDVSAETGGDVTSDGGTSVSTRGVCYATNENPTTSDTCTSDGSGMGSFTSTLTGLNPFTTYYARAYATNEGGTAYGGQEVLTTLQSFTLTTAIEGSGTVSPDSGTYADGTIVEITATSADGWGFKGWSGDAIGRDNPYSLTIDANKSVTATFSELQLATLTTSEVSNVTNTAALSGGNITSDGGFPVTERGVCYATNENPTTSDTCTSDGTGTGNFSSTLTDLNPFTTYYARAYATNEGGTAYGGLQSFVTLQSFTLTTAIEGSGTVSPDSGTYADGTNVEVTATPADGWVFAGWSGDATGNDNPFSLTMDANKSVKSSFSELKLATLTTTAVDSVTGVSAKSGGNITSDGGFSVTERGVCYATNENPTTSDTCTSDGTDAGNFSSTLTGLNPATIYYVRAYATNMAGTAYGEMLSFTTNKIIPSLITTEISKTTPTSAVSGGEITSDGGATVTARGVVWSTSPAPRVDSNLGMTTDDSGTGTFTSTLTDLNSASTYYMRAYATNEVGTAYGAEKVLVTQTLVVEVTNIATGEVWMDRNLGATRAATSYNDVQSYGYLYQWGRGKDGHQQRSSQTTTVLSSTDQPGHDKFITTNSDWRSPWSDNLWQGVSGINNPCPDGFRLPTVEEWDAEHESWSRSDYIGAFNSPLKLPVAGRRLSGGSLNSTGSQGSYWSSTISEKSALNLLFDTAAYTTSLARVNGMSVRCIKD